MNKKKTTKLESPLCMTKDIFINTPGEVKQPNLENKPAPEKQVKGRAQTVTFTLNNLDIDTLEQQLDRATSLNKRNKSKSAIIRMALRALENTSDEDYSELYDKF